MMSDSCLDRQKLIDDLHSASRRYEQAVKHLTAAVGIQNEFEVAFRKCAQVKDALDLVKAQLNEHVIRHHCV